MRISIYIVLSSSITPVYLYLNYLILDSQRELEAGLFPEPFKLEGLYMMKHADHDQIPSLIYRLDLIFTDILSRIQSQLEVSYLRYK